MFDVVVRCVSFVGACCVLFVVSACVAVCCLLFVVCAVPCVVCLLLLVVRCCALRVVFLSLLVLNDNGFVVVGVK